MLRLTLLVVCVAGSWSAVLEDSKLRNGDSAGGLASGPTPGEGERMSEKRHKKRQFFLPQQPQIPYIPIYIPYRQVVEVHHVVMLQPPACPPATYPPQCPPPGTGYPQPAPGPYPQPTPGPYPQGPFPATPTTTAPPTTMGGLDDRAGPMGGGGTNTTMPRRPSRCVWAIVACCSPDSTSIRYSCFELLGCPGAFWGVNPCEPGVVQAAANTALNFYMSGGAEEEPPTNSL